MTTDSLANLCSRDSPSTLYTIEDEVDKPGTFKGKSIFNKKVNKYLLNPLAYDKHKICPEFE